MFDSSSGPDAKIRLYRSLFAGREDVYATRWAPRPGNATRNTPRTTRPENSSGTKSGWSPKSPDGHRPKVQRRYLPMDDSVVSAHLSGRITAGLYPLIEGDRCRLLACDLDKGSWLLDSLAFLEVCNDVGVPACLERSRSGNGAHVWIFFDDLVEASAARRLGTGLLRDRSEGAVEPAFETRRLGRSGTLQPSIVRQGSPGSDYYRGPIQRSLPARPSGWSCRTFSIAVASVATAARVRVRFEATKIRPACVRPWASRSAARGRKSLTLLVITARSSADATSRTTLSLLPTSSPRSVTAMTS